MNKLFCVAGIVLPTGLLCAILSTGKQSPFDYGLICLGVGWVLWALFTIRKL